MPLGEVAIGQLNRGGARTSANVEDTGGAGLHAIAATSGARYSAESDRTRRSQPTASESKNLARAQRAGSVRANVKAAEVYAVMAGTARALAHDQLRPAARARAVTIVIDGLRA